MSAIARPEVLIAIRMLSALIFLSAAVGKMRFWTVFEGVVANYRLLPRALIPAVAYALPPLEALIGACLLLGVAAPWAPLAAAVLLGVFAIAMTVNLLRGRSHIDCGCFQGALKQTLRWPLVARNAVLMLLVGFVGAVRARQRVGCVQRLNGRQRAVPDPADAQRIVGHPSRSSQTSSATAGSSAGRGTKD
jgi:uncharacterized membrane protein YphA (DoxX/SURF4 family)